MKTRQPQLEVITLSLSPDDARRVMTAVNLRCTLLEDSPSTTTHQRYVQLFRNLHDQIISQLGKETR